MWTDVIKITNVVAVPQLYNFPLTLTESDFARGKWRQLAIITVDRKTDWNGKSRGNEGT